MSRLMLCLSLCLIFSFPFSVTHAKMITINTVGTYLMGDGPDEKITVAKGRAREEAIRIAVKEIGEFVDGYSKTHNYILTDDEVKVIASQVLKITEESIVPDITQDNHIVWKCSITAVVDDEAIDVKNILSNRDAVDNTILLEKRIQQLQKENLELKNRYKKCNNDTERNTTAIQIRENENAFTEAIYSLPVYTTEGWRSGIDLDSILYDKVAGIITFASTEVNRVYGGKTVTKAKIYVNENKFLYISAVSYPADDGKPSILKGAGSITLEPIEPDSLHEKYQQKLYAYLGITNAPVNKPANWFLVKKDDYKDGTYQFYYMDLNNIKYDIENKIVYAYDKCHSTKYNRDFTGTVVYDLKNQKTGHYAREAGRIIMTPANLQDPFYQLAEKLFNENTNKKHI